LTRNAVFSDGAIRQTRTSRGFLATPFTRYSKCRWGPVVQPVRPT